MPINCVRRLLLTVLGVIFLAAPAHAQYKPGLKTYDEQGRLRTSNGDDGTQWLYTYDDDGDRHIWGGSRLIATEKSDGTVIAYAYNAEGRRVRKRTTRPGRAPEFFDYPQAAARTLPDAESPRTDPPRVSQAVFTRSEPIQTDDASLPSDRDVVFSSREIDTDQFHRIIRVVSTSGDVTTYEYFPEVEEPYIKAVTYPDGTRQESTYASAKFTYNAILPFTASALRNDSAMCEGSSNRVGFGGYFYNCSTKTYLTPSGRIYDPEIARFQQQDSYLGKTDDPPSLHRYTYANDNPTRFIDPTGFASFDTGSTSDLPGQNWLQQEAATYDPQTGQTSITYDNPNSSPNEQHFVTMKSGASKEMRALLATSGNEKAAEKLDRMRREGLFKFAAVTIGEDDLDVHGQVDVEKVYGQFLSQVGIYGDRTDVRRALVSSIAGMRPGEIHDISGAYDVAYARSWTATYNQVMGEMGGSLSVPFYSRYKANRRAAALSAAGMAPADVEFDSNAAAAMTVFGAAQTALMLPAAARSLAGAGSGFAAGFEGQAVADMSSRQSPMTGYTWYRTLQARYGARNVEWASPNLPSEPLTLGALRTSKGDFDLASGWSGPGGSMPKGSPGFDIVSRTHVEGHAAALMQKQNISEGMLFINNPTICVSCTGNIPRMLAPLGPEGNLWVVTPNGSVTPFSGVTK